MKNILFALACLTFSARASQIPLVGIDQNASIHEGTSTYSWDSFASRISQDIENIGARILVAGMPAPAGWEDPEGSVPPPAGQTTPPLEFDDDISEFEIGLHDKDTLERIGYADWGPIRIDTTDKAAGAIFEVGYWDENKDYEFIPVVQSQAISLGSLWDSHTYTPFDMNPSDATPWRPSDFYIPVPEPSALGLCLIGASILLRSRSWTRT